MQALVGAECGRVWLLMKRATVREDTGRLYSDEVHSAKARSSRHLTECLDRVSLPRLPRTTGQQLT